MRPDVAALVYRLPEPLRPIVHAEVKGRKPDDQKAHITAAYGGLLAEVVDATAYLADEAKRRAHAAASRPGAMKGATSQRRNPVDPAGARWKPDYRGPLNRDVFPKWGKVPVYVPPLVRSMSPPVAKTIIVIGDVVDHQGEFVLPRATHAERIGNSPSNAHAAMKTLEAADGVAVCRCGRGRHRSRPEDPASGKEPVDSPRDRRDAASVPGRMILPAYEDSLTERSCVGFSSERAGSSA